MPSLDIGNVPFLYVTGALLLILLGTLAVYAIEMHRAGSAPMSEWYNDRVVPLFGNRQRLRTTRPHEHAEQEATVAGGAQPSDTSSKAA